MQGRSFIRMVCVWVGCLLLCGSPYTVAAQPWSGILASSRAVDWGAPGVAGGIPARTTLCQTLNPGATAAQINSAIQGCPAGQTVFLNAGTYTLTAGITFAGKNNVTLRGAGPNQTYLIFTGSDACTGIFAAVCIASSWINNVTPQNQANWTGGYAKGTTIITLSSVTGLAVGNTIILDQLEDTTDSGELFVCANAGVCSYANSGGGERAGRGQQQHVKVTNIAGTQVTIEPPISMPNWTSGKSPQATWVNAAIAGDGLEDVSMDIRGESGATGVGFLNAQDSWVKGVRILKDADNRNHVWLYQTVRVTVRDSYFYGGGGESLSYGIEPYGSTQLLIENNILEHVTAPIAINSCDTLSVYGYNFTIDNNRTAGGAPTNYMSPSYHMHDIGIHMILWEGNDGLALQHDDWHGTHNLITSFRNHLYGDIFNDPPKSDNTTVMSIRSFSRLINVIGNVLGRTGYYDTYGPSTATGGGNTWIYTIGVTFGNPGPDDSLTKPTLMRWGNYDTVTGAVRWCGNSGNTGWSTTCGSVSEVPTGLTTFPNAVPSTETLPASFYLTAKPAWFGSVPWPPIGPDVTGGSVSGYAGHANKIPARLCWEGMAVDGANPYRVFTPSTCYAATSGGTVPTILRVIR